MKQRKSPLRLFCVALLVCTCAVAQHIRAVIPSHASPETHRFYSPAVDAGDYVYISGQGPLRDDGTVPSTFDDQLLQALTNIKAIVEAAGLTMDNVVYTQVYLEDLSKYEQLNKLFHQFFPKVPPRSRRARRSSRARSAN